MSTTPTDEEVLAWGEKLSDADKEQAKNQAMYNRWLELQKPKPAPNYNDDSEYQKAIREMPYHSPQKDE